MGARGKEGRRLSLSRQIRVDREVHKELLRRVAELSARIGDRRVSYNDVLRELLFNESDD